MYENENTVSTTEEKEEEYEGEKMKRESKN